MGANDGLLLTGIEGIVAGAISMAASGFVSVSGQAYTQRADRQREKQELKDHPGQELAELTALVRQSGLDDPLARQVAEGLMRKDALAAHAGRAGCDGNK